MDVLWSNVDFNISNVNKCRYIEGQHNGDLRLFFDRFEINVDNNSRQLIFNINYVMLIVIVCLNL